MTKKNETSQTTAQCAIQNVTTRYYCAVDIGTGESKSAFTVFKGTELKWHTSKRWVAKLYIMWIKIKGGVIIQETN